MILHFSSPRESHKDQAAGLQNGRAPQLLRWWSRQPEASSGFALSQAATPASCPTTSSALPTQCRQCPVLRLQPRAVALPVTQASMTDIPTQMQARDPFVTV